MSKNQQFQKFITYKSNAAKKEGFKQEKRSVKKERAAAIEKRFEEKRAQKSGVVSQEPGAEKAEPKVRFKKGDIKALPANKHIKPETIHGPKYIAPKEPAPVKGSTGAKNPRSKPGSLEEKKLLQGKPLTDSKPVPKITESNSHKPEAVRTNEAKSGLKTLDSSDQVIRAGIKQNASDLMPLNKYVAHSGVCSRRDAAELIRKGEVSVNNTVITEPGTKVSPKDTITIKGKKLTPSKNFVYILLNKPKDYITTLEDPEGRKTVLDLIKRATDERVYPVGRLDRNTSGVLLFTNDGDLAQNTFSPQNLIKKIYEVRLDKQLTKADFEKLQHGLELEDGFIQPDAIGYTDAKDKTIIGIEIHSGRNRIVRRIFESLGYDVRNLDRVTYAGLTKKNVQRGKWRLLTEKEVRILRHFNPQTKTDKVKKAAPQSATKIAK